MTTQRGLAQSRPMGVAEHLLNGKVDAAMVLQKRVLLIGDAPTLSTPNGRNCFFDSYLLLVRIVGHLTVAVPDELQDLRAEIEERRARSHFAESVTIVTAASITAFTDFAAILNVGSKIDASLPWTSVNSNGWLARVSSGRTALPINCDRENAIGALMAASLGATEIFKRIFSIPDDVAPMMDLYELSLFEMTTDAKDFGPELPIEMDLGKAVLVGGGAIGNGIALLATQLPVTGDLQIVDKQDFGDENFGTCLLMESKEWIDTAKAMRLAEFINGHKRIRAHGARAYIEVAIANGIIDPLEVDLVITALDDVDARCEAQGIWPSLIIDGGINEVGAAVIEHQLAKPGSACLKCWFERPLVDERIQQAKWTGLSAERLGDMSRLLTDEDINAARVEKREWLQQCKSAGKQLCSVITEAQLQSRLGVDVEEGFRPSVPFVATASAAMVMSAVVKAKFFSDAPSGSLFQLANLFIGPDALIVANRAPKDSCVCVTHRSIINRLHARRITKAGQ